jgi:flagellar hook-associated protein 2
MTSTTGASTGASILTALGASTIDIKTLAQNLTDATKAAEQAQIDSKKTAVQSRISSIGKIVTAVDAFNSALTTLGDPKTIQRLPTTSDASKVTIAFKDGQVPSTFSGQVEVQNLAVDAAVLFPPVSDLSASLGGSGRTLTLTSGSKTNTIDLGAADSLTALRDKINTISGYKASIIAGGSPTNKLYYLSINHGSGAANTFSAGVSDANGNVALTGTADTAQSGLVSPDTTPASGRVVAGQDAHITIDGVSVTSSSNVFSDVLPGVDITAVATTTSPVTLSSTVNKDNLTSAISTLISGYNALIGVISSETNYNPDDTTKNGSLVGNAAARTLLQQLSQFTTQSVKGYDDGTYSLAELGVKTNRDGTLTLDTTAFATVLAKNPDKVEAVLASRQTFTDAGLKVGSVASTVTAGKYTVARSASGAWTIGGSAATLNGLTLTGNKGTAAEGLSIVMPPLLATSTSAYSSDFYLGRGMLERFATMLGNVKTSTSPIESLLTSQNSQMTDLGKQQTTLDDRMTALNARYMKQFTAMNSTLATLNNTKTSLTGFMDAWTNSLKSG